MVNFSLRRPMSQSLRTESGPAAAVTTKKEDNPFIQALSTLCATTAGIEALSTIHLASDPSVVTEETMGNAQDFSKISEMVLAINDMLASLVKEGRVPAEDTYAMIYGVAPIAENLAAATKALEENPNTCLDRYVDALKPALQQLEAAKNTTIEMDKSTNLNGAMLFTDGGMNHGRTHLNIGGANIRTGGGAMFTGNRL